MPIDPQLAELLRQVDEAPPLSTNGVEGARELFRQMNAFLSDGVPEVPVAAVEDIALQGAAGPLGARVYRPDGAGPHPTLAFFHGGGFTIGDVDSYDRQCRLLCREAGAVVLSVDYRLAPEHPFPSAADDALAATSWAADHIEELGGDADRLGVGGDSAGGNLAAVVAREARDAGPAIAAQLLIYPATDLGSERPSHQRNGRGYFLTLDDMEWFHANYLRGSAAADDPRASPLRAPDLRRLPPAIVATAEFDPLVDDGDAYAEALAAAGVRVVHRRFDGLVHGFFAFGPLSPTADAAVRRICSDLREVLC